MNANPHTPAGAGDRAARDDFDPVDLEVLWSQLVTVVDEAAYAILRTSMSKIVVEARDFGVLLLDPQGRMLVCDAGVASKIGTNSIAARELLRHFPADTLAPGDIMITNNPWWVMGHLNDVAVVAPMFHDGRLVGFAECMAHLSDIGGCLSAQPRELFEEGLIIPPLKVMAAGRENDTFFRILKANVRVPEQIASDVRALMSGCRVMQRELDRFLAETALPDLQRLGRAIVSHSERTMRAAIRGLIPPGVYRGHTRLQGAGQTMEIRAALTVDDEGVQIDFAGSSPQQNIGINSTMVYTHVWAAYAMKCLLCPTLPNNEGTFAPLRVTAPEGCFLNPVYPAPVRLKSSSGHFIPDAIVHALESALSQRLLAESGNKFVVLFSGAQDNGRRFSESMFIMGGMGARLNKPGLDCRSFPANSSNLPVEVLEASVPVLVHRKRIRHGSGGDGAWRGGNGQDFTFESLSAAPMTVRASHGKLTIPPQGLRGGGNGQTGSIALNGEDVPDKTPMTVRKGDIVTLSTPGAGGMGKPAPQKEQGK